MDRGAGRPLAQWLRLQGHDLREAREISPHPGDAVLLRLAAEDGRILVTIDTDFAALVYLAGTAHTGIIRLPDVSASARVALVREILARHGEADLANAIVTAKGSRIRFTPVSPRS